MTPLGSTYRFQFNAAFTFADAEALVPYLARLGISHLYASPIFAARAGSTHGYDAVDPNRLNPELGTEAEFASLVAALRRAGMGMIVDIVPNHMAVHRSNRMLQEAFCLGPESDAARVFDIDWSHDRVALPFLGGPLDDVIGEIVLALDEPSGMLMAVYHDHAFALRPATTARLLEAAGLDGDLWRGLEEAPDQARFEDAALATSRLDGDAREALDLALEQADVSAVLAEQRWRLADWRSARDTLSHRRFFNITELIGVRVEDPAVFDRTHRLAIELVRKGDVDGLRIDHIDGLGDPAGYSDRLRAAIGPDAYIFVEKILGLHERLPDWPVDGTTGYERLNEINRLFVDPEAYARLDAHLVSEGALSGDFADRLVAAKRQVLDEMFAPEVDGLAAVAAELDTGLAPPALRAAAVVLLVHFPVYRSYVTADGWSPDDEAAWQEALDRARRHEDEAAAADAATLWRAARAEAGAAFAIRFQQLSGPAMAKGLEDTELYRSVALTSVNEVGSEPDAPGASAGAGHRAVQARIESGDRSLIPLATHDTKRGPDTRARINALSRDADGWIAAHARWREAAAPILRDPGAPDAADLWLIHQTVVGAWPIDEARLVQYLEKAMREAKRHTRWEEPNAAYEEPVLAFARDLLAAPEGEAARREIEALVARIEPAARTNGVAQTILQLALPGVPDIYQGTEIWDRSLVDPDNRRPIDWRLRQRLLDSGPLPALAEDDEGAQKARVLAALLDLRRTDRTLFVEGEYRPLADAGECVFAFLRRSGGGRELLVAVPLAGCAEDVALPPEAAGDWRDLLTGEAVSLGAGAAMSEARPFLLLSRGG